MFPIFGSTKSCVENNRIGIQSTGISQYLKEIWNKIPVGMGRIGTFVANFWTILIAERIFRGRGGREYLSREEEEVEGSGSI